MTFTLLSQSSSSPCQHSANHYNTSIITLLHYNKDMPFFIPINLSWFFKKIMLYKILKTTNLQSSKIQGTYFKICALYFKIYGLYFLRQAMCFFTHPAHKKTQPQKTDFIFGKAGCWGIAAARLWAKIVSRRCYKASGSTLPNSSEFHYMAKYTTPLLPRINPETTYDLVISFLTPHQIGLSRVNARRRVAWIHTDYTKIWVDAQNGRCVYRCL